VTAAPEHAFRGAEHLPNRGGGAGRDPYELPRQRAGTTPQMHGRYPDYDVMAEASHWDEATRAVVLARLEPPPPPAFFTPAQAAALDQFCDDITGQDADPRIPVLRMVSERLGAGERDGYRYAGMPDDGETWRMLARGLDAAAGPAGYAALPEHERLELVQRLSKGALDGPAWRDVDPARAWTVVTRMILAAFYSHPWAWNEIGYGGPAYPRGFARLGVGQSEAWEAVPVAAVDVDPADADQ